MANDSAQVSLADAGGDTDPATDVEETEAAVVGAKRKSAGSAGPARKYASDFSYFTVVLIRRS